MLMSYALVVLLALILTGPAEAQVHVDIHLPAPPQLVIVPGVPAVQYAPAAPVNVFFYSGQYWAFGDDGWHVSRHHDGPWIFVDPQFVPRPLLSVPVRYYPVPPGHWQQWEDREPPRWHEEWGREWADKREWRGREHEREHARAWRGREHERDNEQGEGRGRGHGRD
jgi:hypothetical protein